MKIRKNKWRCVGGKRRIALLAAALLLLWGNPIVSRAEPKGVVIPNSVNIRKMPEQGSEVIGSSTAGKEIDIRGQVESGGIIWYQVYINADTLGYVRADMIEKKGDETIPTVSATAADNADQPADGGGENAQEAPSQPTASEGGAKVEAQESMDPQYATTKGPTRVRQDPSTSNPHLDSLTPGTQVVVRGKSEGSDSKTWYYVTYAGGNGSERTGFIRSDLLDLGELLPVEETPEEAPAETPEAPAEPVRNDYELKIETDSEGVETWYLYDNINRNKEKLQLLLDGMSSQSVDDKKETGSIVKQRIVIVVLLVLLALLAAAVVVLAFKLRDTYYEDDDEGEEDARRSARREAAERDERRSARREGTEREQSSKRRTTGNEERPARRRTAAGEEGELRRQAGQSRGTDRQEDRRREREVSYQEDASAEAVSPASRRKSKNFLLDDDEFEFEFLNMDDKDLK